MKAPSFKKFRASSAASSRVKQRNRRRDTKAELALRRELWHLGVRYRKNVERMPGKPDLVFAKPRVVVFCDGDFWHGRNWRRLRARLKRRANPGYWIPKIRANRERDRRTSAALRQQGWHVIRLWETDVLRDVRRAACQIRDIVDGRGRAHATSPLARRFADLFAGLGGFHMALKRLGLECVFASESDEGLRDLYERNFGTRPAGDIRRIRAEDIPKHDVLCAGFPCQPFSKAGDQTGLDCPRNGDLFGQVLRLLDYHKPEYFILENVPNLQRHRNGATWLELQQQLGVVGGGYDLRVERLSPHEFGIPQIRDRLYIVGRKGAQSLDGFSWPLGTGEEPRIQSVLDKNPTDARPLPDYVAECIDVWQDFITRYPPDQQLPSFPIWSMEFGATYPYEDHTPHAAGTRALCWYLGSHGHPLRELSPGERMQGLPSYARTAEDRFPRWKTTFIRRNRELYETHRHWIDEWLPRIKRFPPSLQKLEWNCKGEERNIWKFVLQLRASGVRVKRPSTAPSLIAMTTTQVPIIAWQRRYMTPRECARLQCMHNLTYLPHVPTRASKALGNAVNVDLVQRIAERLLWCGPPGLAP